MVYKIDKLSFNLSFLPCLIVLLSYLTFMFFRNESNFNSLQVNSISMLNFFDFRLWISISDLKKDFAQHNASLTFELFKKLNNPVSNLFPKSQTELF